MYFLKDQNHLSFNKRRTRKMENAFGWWTNWSILVICGDPCIKVFVGKELVLRAVFLALFLRIGKEKQLRIAAILSLYIVAWLTPCNDTSVPHGKKKRKQNKTTTNWQTNYSTVIFIDIYVKSGTRIISLTGKKSNPQRTVFFFHELHLYSQSLSSLISASR